MSSEMDEVIKEYIAECQEMIQRVGEKLSTLEQDQNQQDTLRSIARDLHTIKGNSQLFGFLQVGKVSHTMEECLQLLHGFPKHILTSMVDLLLEGMDVISQLFSAIVATNTEPPDLPLVISVCEKISAFVKTNTAKNQVTRVPEPGALENQNAVQDVTQKVKQVLDEGPSDTIRVQVDILDKLMNLTGELVLIRNQFTQLVKKSENEEMLRVSQRLQVVSSEIQNDVMKTRMQPIGNIIGKFTRIVRDTAKSVGKQAELSLSGIETEVDKSLIEAIRDPLTHILRNAVDHGIESIAERKKSGKSETGLISIRAYHDGGHVVVEIADDGRGLSRMKIGSKAIERGLLTPEALAKMSDRDIYNFIFYPGFSTANKVSNLSGRGVGMDVVRTNIEKMGGSIEISSTPGKGTTFKLRIPLTLAIIPALVVRVNGQRYAIPQVNLDELIQLTREQESLCIHTVHDQPVYRLRGLLVPLIYLEAALKKTKQDHGPSVTLKSRPERNTHDTLTIVILHTDGRSFGLVVHEIEDTADIVVKPIPNFIKDLGAFSGATVLGDGDIALTIDVGGIADLAGLKDHGHQESTSKEKTMKHGVKIQNTHAPRSTDCTEYLRVDIQAKGVYGIRLTEVNRLEDIRMTEIQSSGDQKVVKYRDSLLPLLSVAEVLGFNRGWPQQDSIPTVVVSDNNRLYGLVVENIVDICSTNSSLDKDLSLPHGLLGSLVENGEVITMLDTHQIIHRHFSSHLGNF